MPTVCVTPNIATELLVCSKRKGGLINNDQKMRKKLLDLTPSVVDAGNPNNLELARKAIDKWNDKATVTHTKASAPAKSAPAKKATGCPHCGSPDHKMCTHSECPCYEKCRDKCPLRNKSNRKIKSK